MHRHGGDVGEVRGHAFREEDVSELGLPVARPFGALVCGLEGGEVDPLGRMQGVAVGAEGHEAHVILAAVGRPEHHWTQELQQHGVPEVVGPELNLESFGGEGGWDGHDSCIGDEDVEAWRLECVYDSVTDTVARGGKVAFDEGDCRLWGERLDLGENF